MAEPTDTSDLPAYTKPLPDPNDPVTQAFWAHSRRGELAVQRCPNCGYLRWPPGPMCPECQTQSDVWAVIEATGTLYSTAIYHRAFAAAFKDDLPYAIGLIQLDAGPRMYGLMRGEHAGLRLDGRVRAVFEPVTEEVTFVRWAMQE